MFFSCDAYLNLLDSNTPEVESNLTVTAPSNNETLYEENTQTIEWTTEGSISNVKIELYYSSSSNGTYYNYTTIASTTNNDGSYSWYISGSYSSNYYYKIRISDYNDSSVFDDSEYFQIEEEASIAVTAPSYNETLYEENTQTIEWTTEGSISNVKIELYYSSSSNGTYYNYTTIASTTNNDGSYSWYISGSYSSNYYYKIRISDYNDSSVFDDSEYFQIEEEVSEEEVSITVTAPSYGGYSYYDYNSYDIQWTTEGSISNVKIELLYSTSAYGTYYNSETIDSYENNDGSYSWYISGNSYNSSYYYKIRISDYNDSSVYDDSEYFQIEEEVSITVTTPSYGGYSYYDYNSYDIQWTTEGSISNVKIELLYSTSAYGTYYNSETIDSYENNDGSYSWYISGNSYNSSYYYKYRISDYYDSTVYGESNYFRIY